jgi:hypothetical protein
MELGLTCEDSRDCVVVRDTEAINDARAGAKICLSVKPVTHVHVQAAKTVKEPWVILQKVYESKDLKR